MGLKSDDFSNETDPVAVASEPSINEVKPGDRLQHIEREASNLLCVNSNHDSYSDNIESKAIMRPSGVSDELEDVGIQRTFSNNYYGTQSVDGHDDNISRASRASDANNRDLDIKNSFHSSRPVCSLGSEKVLSSQKLDLSEPLSIKEGEAGSIPLSMQSPYSHSQSGNVSIGGSSEISSKIPKSEANIDNNCGGSLDNGGKSLNKGEQDESTQMVELHDKPESPLQALSRDQSYESDPSEDDPSEVDPSENDPSDNDPSENDVEVCDICGDAGQEDLLAICSKCSEGAEHTYCMREMLQKVPEGYWLCEECKLVEEIENQKQGLDVEREKANKLSSSMQSLARGHAENREGALSLKQKAVETSMGSPKSLSPSMQSLDKGKVKPYLQNSSGKNDNDMHENVRSPTSGTQLETAKGTLLKSSSFNTSSSKPKVKLSDEVVLQKRKSAREHTSLDSREELGRMMDESMSFKSTNSGQLNAGESNFKMLSSKYLHVQDLKGLKKVREQKSLKRNKQETKVVQSDGKQSTLSRSTSNLAHKGVESAVTSAIIVPSTNGPISSEEKLNQLSQMEEPSSSSSWTAEKQPNNSDRVMADGLSQSLDSTTLSEKYREDIYKGNKLKAAIEAAIRLRPGIRKRASDVPSSISKKAKNTVSEGINDGQENIRNQVSISNIKLLNSHSTDAVSAVSSVLNPSMREMSIPPLVLGSSVSKISAIPELEYIWQGAFEVHKSGKPLSYSAAIQAHLSTLASPKVLDVVNTFPHKVSLNEVPRSSTWPTHFHDSGPKEDNIALYFFAKDLRSYENYKVLLDTMVKNDFALKGAFDGVELLIFPSNQLPENCQRWNALLFLWGVFKGRRSNSSNSVKSVCN